ncbi:hypothetical protein AMES_7829 [Amycolatopsis mediterranei S699]|uniref:Uncharacterized protein n=2 Tax=Amycolatopsis mediterranei TaxID=33910 RepID=A0A0H3DHH5_AMYMU|nr:DUF4291 family protein [Amycolatopsis mediterranei]ADJ49652.1 conserved hypothetical protein [Amycolatopsis mediterranei U32]AEK46636.1 hypothetical protein RAM_40845 [Amycolatopsis mediterranei S699]AFO81362.1 hypothetical protein AMES_7829 [Amycolatopsis mediterranei S699]AGT88490.1 hypothetical protein B737_7829 [Amycolatopsis mediterranei RB]KDO08099.1 hypothetical protein DV26_27835 [Amycolatopsis mediterranei]
MFEEQRVPDRQVRAAQTETTVRVYQACSPAVADAALEEQTFERGGTVQLTPSFRLAAYGSENGRKPGHERILAIDLTRDGFEQALTHSHVEWEAERDLDHTALNFQAIRIGLDSAPADEWITAITDVTPVVRDIAGLLATDQLHLAVKLVPHEPPYELG